MGWHPFPLRSKGSGVFSRSILRDIPRSDFWRRPFYSRSLNYGVNLPNNRGNWSSFYSSTYIKSFNPGLTRENFSFRQFSILKFRHFFLKSYWIEFFCVYLLGKEGLIKKRQREIILTCGNIFGWLP